MRRAGRAGHGLVWRAICRPGWAAAIGLALILAAGVAATRPEPTSSTDLLVGSRTDVGSATERLARDFGEEPIVVVLRGDLENMLAPGNLVPLVGLEGRMARIPGVKRVFGPGTFVNQSVVQVQRVFDGMLKAGERRADTAARAAARAARARGDSPREQRRRAAAARARSRAAQREQYEALLVRFGSIGFPALANRSFVASLVYGTGAVPKQRLRALFPDIDHAVVYVRPEAGLSDERTRELGEEIELLARGAKLREVQVSVAGAPLVGAALAGEVTDELARLAPVLVGVMIVALLAALGVRRQTFAAFGLAALAVALTAGLCWPLGLGLSPASIAALPVVLGLAVDYAVQLHARYWSERGGGAAPRPAAIVATLALAPPLGLAAAAMAAGFLLLTLSSVPLIDRVGLILALGTACSLFAVLGFGGAVLAATDGHRPPTRRYGLPAPRLRLRGGIMLALVGVLAVAGLAASSQSRVDSDLASLAPPGQPELRQLGAVQRELGSSGQLEILVTAEDVTDPAVLRYMAGLTRRAVELEPKLRPAPSLADILTVGGSVVPGRADVRRLLRLIPRYFLDVVMSRDRRRAQVSLGVPLVPVEQQAALLARLKPALADAPAGVRADPGGLVASAATSLTALESQRPWLLLEAGLAVFLLLLCARRRFDRAAIPLVPALLTAGLSSLGIALTGTHLSALGAAVEPLVLAVGVEFGVLLEARYREARHASLSPARARREAVARVGGPVAVSALTVALGFAVLAAARLEILRQFGLLVAVEVVICAAAAILLVPALCEAAEGRGALCGRRARPRLGRLLPGRMRSRGAL